MKSDKVIKTIDIGGNTPPASKENPSPRPTILPDTFMLLEYGVK